MEQSIFFLTNYEETKTEAETYSIQKIDKYLHTYFSKNGKSRNIQEKNSDKDRNAV